jgi:hypothetical protein
LEELLEAWPRDAFVSSRDVVVVVDSNNGHAEVCRKLAAVGFLVLYPCAGELPVLVSVIV